MVNETGSATRPAGSGSVTVDAAALVHHAARLLAAAGLAPAAAADAAGWLVEADLRGLGSHGVAMLPLYLAGLRDGGVSARPEIRILADAGALVRLDAGHGLGQSSSPVATDLAIERARSHGLGCVAVCHGHHFGAASSWALRMAEAGLIGLALSNGPPLMAAPGGTRPVLGNNPVALAVLDDTGRALVADTALSLGSVAKIRAALRQGALVPDGWSLDADGRPTTDPAAALPGSLIPIGGAKGFSLALAVEALTALLAGGPVGPSLPRLAQTALPYDGSHLFLAIDPAAIGTADSVRRGAAALIAAIESSGSGSPPPRAPGQGRRDLAARQQRDGVAVETAVLEQLGWPGDAP